MKRILALSGGGVRGIVEVAFLEAVERVAIPDVPIPYSRPLEKEVNPQVEDIVAAVESVR